MCRLEDEPALFRGLQAGAGLAVQRGHVGWMVRDCVVFSDDLAEALLEGGEESRRCRSVCLAVAVPNAVVTVAAAGRRGEFGSDGAQTASDVDRRLVVDVSRECSEQRRGLFDEGLLVVSDRDDGSGAGVPGDDVVCV